MRRSVGYVLWAAWMALVAALVVAYGPYLDNPLVFDDDNLFATQAVYDYAQLTNFLQTRGFPYFTLGVIHVLSDGDLFWNRSLSLCLHGLVAVALYVLLMRLVECRPPQERRWIAWATCGWFVLNPVAVYGAGYLVQRTILLATLFAVMAINFYLRAWRERRSVDFFSAALLFGCAMLCKEHAVVYPVAAVCLTPLVVRLWRRETLLRLLGFLACVAPFCWWVIAQNAQPVASSYEFFSGEIVDQISSSSSLVANSERWILSALVQASLFWKYIFLWFFPFPGSLSADLRVDFSVYEGLWGISCFAFFMLFSAWAFRWFVRPAESYSKRYFAAVAGFLLILFLPELATIRLQEPFVLYRSYLWAPGYALLVAGGLSKTVRFVGEWKGKAIFLVVGGILLVFVSGTQERLQSFSSVIALWRDAERKLPHPDVPGADRIYYNIANELGKEKRYDEALVYADAAIKLNAKAFQGYLMRSKLLIATGRYSEALEAIEDAEARNLDPRFVGYIQFKRCAIASAQSLGQETVRSCLKRSVELGYEPAKIYLQMM